MNKLMVLLWILFSTPHPLLAAPDKAEGNAGNGGWVLACFDDVEVKLRAKKMLEEGDLNPFDDPDIQDSIKRYDENNPNKEPAVQLVDLVKHQLKSGDPPVGKKIIELTDGSVTENFNHMLSVIGTKSYLADDILALQKNYSEVIDEAELSIDNFSEILKVPQLSKKDLGDIIPEPNHCLLVTMAQKVLKYYRYRDNTRVPIYKVLYEEFLYSRLTLTHKVAFYLHEFVYHLGVKHRNLKSAKSVLPIIGRIFDADFESYPGDKFASLTQALYPQTVHYRKRSHKTSAQSSIKIPHTLENYTVDDNPQEIFIQSLKELADGSQSITLASREKLDWNRAPFTKATIRGPNPQEIGRQMMFGKDQDIKSAYFEELTLKTPFFYIDYKPLAQDLGEDLLDTITKDPKVSFYPDNIISAIEFSGFVRDKDGFRFGFKTPTFELSLKKFLTDKGSFKFEFFEDSTPKSFEVGKKEQNHEKYNHISLLHVKNTTVVLKTGKHQIFPKNIILRPIAKNERSKDFCWTTHYQSIVFPAMRWHRNGALASIKNTTKKTRLLIDKKIVNPASQCESDNGKFVVNAEIQLFDDNKVKSFVVGQRSWTHRGATYPFGTRIVLDHLQNVKESDNRDFY